MSTHLHAHLKRCQMLYAPSAARLAVNTPTSARPCHSRPVQEPAYWGSWFTTHWTTLAASGVLCTLVGTYPFPHSSPLLMLAFYWLFAAALTSFAYAQSTLFAASRVAGSVSQLLYALSMMPG